MSRRKREQFLASAFSALFSILVGLGIGLPIGFFIFGGLR